MVGQGGAGQPLRVPEVLGPPGGVQECVTGDRVTGSLLRLSEGGEQIAAPAFVGGPGLVEELEGLGVPAGGLVVGELGQGPVTGPGCVGARFGPLGQSRSGEVAGQGGEVVVKAGAVYGLD